MLVLLVLRNYLTPWTKVLGEKLIVIQLVTRISPNPKEKEHATIPYPEPDESNSLKPALFLKIHSNFIIQSRHGSSKFCLFCVHITDHEALPHAIWKYSVISSPLGPSSFVSTLFSSTLNPSSFLNEKDEVKHLYKTTNNIVVLRYI